MKNNIDTLSIVMEILICVLCVFSTVSAFITRQTTVTTTVLADLACFCQALLVIALLREEGKG